MIKIQFNNFKLIMKIVGDGMSFVMKALHNDPLVNQNVMNGPLYPTSFGAAEYAADRNCRWHHPMPNHISSTFCLGKFQLIRI